MNIPKYRVYCIDTKQIYYKVYIIETYNIGCRISIDTYPWEILVSGEYKDGDLMMCSGLFDMKNKEIYEEDILRKEMCSSDDPVYGFYGDEGIVKFKKGAFIVIWSGGTEEYLGEQIISSIEIIGNTYEQKETGNIL